jgi:hypothetical protein
LVTERTGSISFDHRHELLLHADGKLHPTPTNSEKLSFFLVPLSIDFVLLQRGREYTVLYLRKFEALLAFGFGAARRRPGRTAAPSAAASRTSPPGRTTSPAPPTKCGVNLPYKISGDVNCNTYVRARTRLILSSVFS